MHLAIPFALLVGSLVAAAPSIQHAQISVEVTHTDAGQNQADAFHFSEELVMNQGPPGHKNLPFNFTLSARNASGSSHARLPFGFENLQVGDGFIRAELGFATVFALRDGKLITGNRALGFHVARIWPPWVSLWSLNREPRQFFNLIAFSKSLGGRVHHFLEFVDSSKFGIGGFYSSTSYPLKFSRTLTGGF